MSVCNNIAAGRKIQLFWEHDYKQWKSRRNQEKNWDSKNGVPEIWETSDK